MYGDIQKHKGTKKGKEIKESAADKLRWRKRYLETSRILGKLRKRVKAVYNETGLSSIEKRNKIDRLNKRINIITKRIVEKSDSLL